jgi:predicted transcriptional regulator
MEVHLTPEKEAQLQKLAAWSGRDPSQLVQNAVDRLLEEDTEFRSAVREGLASLDRGEYLTEEEMDAFVEEMLRS